MLPFPSEIGLSLITVVFILIAIGIVCLFEEEKKIWLGFLIAIIFLGITVPAIWVPYNIYKVDDHTFYTYKGTVTHEMECDLYNMVEDSKLIRDFVRVYDSDYNNYTRLTFRTRQFDKDHLKKELDKIDGLIYFSSREDYFIDRCESKGPEWEYKFDGSCMKCN